MMMHEKGIWLLPNGGVTRNMISHALMVVCKPVTYIIMSRSHIFEGEGYGAYAEARLVLAYSVEGVLMWPR
jgi:hypothetical protein